MQANDAQLSSSTPTPESGEVDDRPTPQQLLHAEQLGIQLPMGCSKADADDLIGIRASGDVRAKESHRELAEFYGVRHPQYIGKRALFRRIFNTLCDQQRDEELISWYVYRVMRDLYYHRRVNAINSPGHSVIEALASELAVDKKVLNSIRRSDAPDFMFFGTRMNVDGHIVRGTANDTYAYKQVLNTIKQHVEVQQQAEMKPDKNIRTVTSHHHGHTPKAQGESKSSSLSAVVIALSLAALGAASYYFFMHIP